MRDPSVSSGASFGTRLFRAFRNLVVLSLVLGLGGAATYALSLLNSRTYGLDVREGLLVVLKGRMLPWGAEPWQPAEPELADAYAPLQLEGNTALAVAGAKFSERDELDRALFSVIELVAKPRVQSDLAKDLEQGLYYVRRAERLHGLSDEQKQTLKRMQSDLAFYLARSRLDDARKQLEEALGQLKQAADSETKHTREANQMLLLVEPQIKALSDSLRAAVHQISQPAPSPAPVVPAVAPPAPAAPVVAPQVTQEP